MKLLRRGAPTFVLLIIALTCAAGSQPPPPPPGGARIGEDNALAGGMRHDYVRSVVFAGIAEVVSAEHCVPVVGRTSRPEAATRYTLNVVDSWLGEAGVLEVFSDWAICEDEDGGGRYVFDTAVSDRLHFLRVGDRVAFLAVPNWRNEFITSSDEKLGPLLAATMVEGAVGFEQVRSDVLWDVVDEWRKRSGDKSRFMSDTVRRKANASTCSASALREFWSIAARQAKHSSASED